MSDALRDALQAGTVDLVGAGQDVIEAYVARPVDRDAATGGVVVIHHMPGFDEATKEMVRRFASWGYSAICPNLHFREAPGAAPDDAAAASRAAGGVPDERLVDDVGAAVDWLRGQPGSNGKVGVIGHCSGGRQAVLAGCSLPVDAVVDCYGAFVVSDAPSQFALNVTGLGERLPDLRAPLLGLFGREDSHPTPEEVAELDRRLTELGKEHELHSFEDAGHAFFAVDRPSYRPAAATQGWALIRDFFARHLAAAA